jgi:hypothetical protein
MLIAGSWYLIYLGWRYLAENIKTRSIRKSYDSKPSKPFFEKYNESVDISAKASKETILERDSYTCSYCGLHTGLTVVDINSLESLDDFNYIGLRKPEELITICRKCQTGEMTPKEFENLVASLFRNRGFSAKITGGPGDAGIDIRVSKGPDNFIVQCKRYKDKVGVGAIRDFYGALVSSKLEKGYFFTSGDYTSGAIEFANDKPIILKNDKDIATLVANDDLSLD